MEPIIQAQQDLYRHEIELGFFNGLEPKTKIFLDGAKRWGRIDCRLFNPGGCHEEYTPEKFAHDFKAYMGEISETAIKIFKDGATTTDLAIKKHKFIELQRLKSLVKLAIEGREKNGGMQGLLKTYASSDICRRLRIAIEEMHENVWRTCYQSKSWEEKLPEFKPIADSESPNFPPCPEEFYSDQDWEEAIKACRSFDSEKPGFVKYHFKYSLALKLNQYKYDQGEWNCWDQIHIKNEDSIEGPALFLGCLPLKEDGAKRNDALALKDAGIRAVLSAVEVFENHDSLHEKIPITPEEWFEMGIKQLQIPTPDFDTIPMEVILRGVEYIHWNRTHDRPVYVHCKAGKGRSALVVMCYLIKRHGYSAKDAYAAVKTQRKQAGFPDDNSKMKTLIEFEKQWQKGP
jgi:protein-tyrosine phosphatase